MRSKLTTGMPQTTASTARRSRVRSAKSSALRAALLLRLGRWWRPDVRLELIGDGEQERPPLRAVPRSELRLDAQTVHHAGLRDDDVAFQTGPDHAVLASLEER